VPKPLLTVDLIEEQPLPIAAVLVHDALESAFVTFRPPTLTAATVEVLVTGDGRMQALNRDHRGVDATTDVLSLPTAIDTQAGHVIPAANGQLSLGTIVISLPQAERQVGRFGDTLEAELVGLASHGLRHLLGHDHDDDGTWLGEPPLVQ